MDTGLLLLALIMELTSAVTMVKDLVLAVCAVIAAGAAWRGLNTWKRQLRGQTEYELARRVLRAAYKFREGIKGVRSPVMWGHERPQPPEGDASASSSEGKQWFGTFKAYEKRWERVFEARTELEAELLEAEAVWDAEVRKSFDPLFDLENELYFHTMEYLDGLNPDSRTPEMTSEEKRQKREVLYARGNPQKDEFLQKMNQAVNEIDAVLKPHLRSGIKNP